jgi:hypothetical protein
MQSNTVSKKVNPLASYMRQPKIYITLPSQGRWWAPGSLEVTDNGEYPVYSMTARDELIFKTPDALLNGQAMVDVIQSCMPNIKNAWEIPTIDFDLILIAIRLATYGETMSVSHKIPEINEDVDYDLDLRTILDQQQQNQWAEQVAVSPDFIVYVKPLTYKDMNKTSLKAFETQRILTMVNDQTLSEEKKLEIFNESFSNLTKVTVDIIASSIYKIVTPQHEVTEVEFIKEFVNNADKEVFKIIENHISELKKQNDLKPLGFSTTEEQQKLGAPATYKIPLSFNNSNFFG